MKHPANSMMQNEWRRSLIHIERILAMYSEGTYWMLQRSVILEMLLKSQLDEFNYD